MRPPSTRIQPARALSLGRLAAVAGRERGMAVATAMGALAGGRHRARRALRERYPTVAVTGMTGVGKTGWSDLLPPACERPGPERCRSARR